MRLIKKIDKPIPKKTEPSLPPETLIANVEVQDTATPPQNQPTPPTINFEQENQTSDFTPQSPQSLRPIISVGNCGWQPSEILRDLRIDSFYD